MMVVLLSCSDDKNDFVYTSYYIKNYTKYFLELEENYWTGCHSNDSTELHIMKDQIDKSYFYIDSTLLIWSLPDDNKDSSLVITKYKLPFSEKIISYGKATKYEYYYYYVTDSLLQDVKQAMAKKGYYPQLHESW